MRYKFLLLTLMMALVVSSCNMPSGDTPTDTPVLLVTDTPAPPTQTPLPSDTPPPTNTPLPTLTFTPSVPTVTTRINR
jgi:hypothetical protein